MRNLIVLFLAAWTGSVSAIGGTEAYADGKTVYGGFGLRQDNQTEVDPAHASTFRISREGAALRLDLTAKSDVAHKLREKMKSGPVGAEWPEECFEIFLAPPGGSGFVQLAVGPGGKWDSRVREAKTDSDFTWASEVEVGEDGWSAVVTIPFASLGVKTPAKGDKWRFNIARDAITRNGPCISTWAAVGGVFNNPSKFATLYLCAKDELAAAGRANALAEVAALRKELASKDLEPEFDARLKLIEQGGPSEIATEIRDEARVVEKMMR